MSVFLCVHLLLSLLAGANHVWELVSVCVHALLALWQAESVCTHNEQGVSEALCCIILPYSTPEGRKPSECSLLSLYIKMHVFVKSIA